jgi:hypothetical protein
VGAQDLGGEDARAERDLFLFLFLLFLIRLGVRIGQLRLEALEKIAEAFGRDAGSLERAHGVRICLTLGDARIAKLRQQQADVGSGAGRSGEDKLRSGCQSHGAHQAGLGMEFERMADFMSEHARHFVRGIRLLHQPARHDDLPAGRGERIDEGPIDHQDPHGYGIVGSCGCEPAGETVERDAAGRAFALLHAAGELGNDTAPHGLARLLRQHAGDGLRWVQIEEPHAGDDGCHDRDGCDARPQTEQALACRRQGAGPGQQSLAERRICNEKGLGAVGLQAQHYVGCAGCYRHVAPQLAVGPDQCGSALAGREDLQARLAETSPHGNGRSRLPVAEPAVVKRGIRTRRH